MNEPVYAYKTASIAELMAYRDRIGHSVWREMEVKVFTALCELLPDHFYDIVLQVAPERQELFVKVCCLFLLEQSPNSLHPVAFKNGHIIKKY
ncbi:MAG: hypothetical protein MJY66_08380 [Bacteroidaceae bacterium]|nr:hypothetical protein [Bacteroidaceae bacterium]